MTTVLFPAVKACPEKGVNRLANRYAAIQPFFYSICKPIRGLRGLYFDETTVKESVPYLLEFVTSSILKRASNDAKAPQQRVLSTGFQEMMFCTNDQTAGAS